MTETTGAHPDGGAGHDEPIEMSWSAESTPLEAIERALYALADRVSGTTTSADGNVHVQLYPRAEGVKRDVLMHQMRQAVTDQTLRVRIAERTDPVRNLVFAMAFSRSGLASDSTGATESAGGT